MELLKEAEKLKEKVLVFSQSLLTLDLIEEFLSKEENGDWTPALDYYRLDGSTRAEMRMNNMTEFNKLKNSRLFSEISILMHDFHLFVILHTVGIYYSVFSLMFYNFIVD